MGNYRGRVGKFAIADSISYFPRPCFSNVSVYGPLSRMQSTTWGNLVDEEQDIRNDGNKSSRSHRAFEFSVISNGTFFDGWLAYGENLPRSVEISPFPLEGALIHTVCAASLGFILIFSLEL
jgi:hypothetical protein